MKKFLAVLAVLAIAGMSTMAFAADVTLGGSVDIRSRNFSNLDMNDNTEDNANTRQIDTQSRVRLEVNVKAGDAKGKVQLENDWDTWGRFEQVQGTTSVATGVSGTTVTTGRASRIGIREAWLLTPIPGTSVYLKGGHMFLQLGQGWFFRSMKFGSDAWVVYTDIDKLHLGFVNVKVAEAFTDKDDDVDAYVLVATYKFGDATAGIDVTHLLDRRNALGFNTAGAAFDTQLENLGLNFAGKLGPVALRAEIDAQFGKAKGATNDSKFKGNQVVVQGNVPMDPVTVNFTVARGSGDDVTSTSNDIESFVRFLDTDPHYTLLYEYKIAGACGGTNQGFCNTTALSAGAMFAATKNLSLGADVWYLSSTEKVADVTSTTGGTNDDFGNLGTEVDVKINWKLADNLTWNWTLGWLMPGDGLGKDDTMGAQGILSMKF
jgi:hypothetical protein